MTTVALAPTTATDRARAVLRADAVVTAGVGLLALLGPTTSWYGDTPTWLVRSIGAVLLVVGIDLALAARMTGNRLRLAAVVSAELAFAWVAATAVVLAVVELPTAGVEALVLVGLATLAFGIAHTRTSRSLR